MANKTIKLNIRMRSRNGNVRNKYVLMFTSPEPMAMHRRDEIGKNMEDFMSNDKQIIAIELPPNSKFSLIKL